MREFGLTSVEGLPSHEMFPAIAALSAACRFSDCTHMNETGCAVLQALQQGELDENTYISYVKLIKEQRHFDMSATEKKRLGKQGGKMVREAKRFKKRLKG
jgi:ribosome biogenesis GTPase